MEWTPSSCQKGELLLLPSSLSDYQQDMLWEPLHSILPVSRSQVIVFSPAWGDLYSYFHFWCRDNRETNANPYIKQEVTALNYFPLFQLVLHSLIFRATEKREALASRPCLRHSDNILRWTGSFRLHGTKMSHSVLTSPYTIYSFFSQLFLTI